MSWSKCSSEVWRGWRSSVWPEGKQWRDQFWIRKPNPCREWGIDVTFEVPTAARRLSTSTLDRVENFLPDNCFVSTEQLTPRWERGWPPASNTHYFNMYPPIYTLPCLYATLKHSVWVYNSYKHRYQAMSWAEKSQRLGGSKAWSPSSSVCDSNISPPTQPPW